MLASFLISSFIIFVVVLSIVALRTNRIVKDDAENITDNYAREFAALSANNLNEYMDAVRLLSQVFEDFESIKENNRREYFNSQLTNLLERNENFLSLWTIWEPYTIDNRDRSFINKAGSTLIGNYSPTFFKMNGKIHLEENNTDTITTPLFSSEYYTLPKERREETILNPYYYAYSGLKKDEIYQTNLIAPIIVNEQFMGVIGVDVPLSTLQSMVDTIQPFKKSYAMLVTNDGILVTHPDTKLAGTNANDLFPDIDVNPNIANGDDFSFTFEKDGQTYYMSFAPVYVGNTDTPWSIGIAVPYSVIMAKAYNQLITTIILAIIGLVLITLISVFIANRIADPLKKGTSILNDLAIGKIRKDINLNDKAKDELGDMARALMQLSASVKKNTDFAQQIGDATFDSDYSPAGNEDLLGNALLKMQQNLQKYATEQEKESWIQTSSVQMGDVLRGEKSLEDLATEVLSLLGKITDMRVGTIYYRAEDQLNQIGAFCFDNRRATALSFKIGEGIIGQAVKEKRTLVFTEVPEDYMMLQSGLGKTKLEQILIIPFIFNNEVLGVIEIGFSKEVPELQREFLDRMNESIAIGFKSIKDRDEMNKLLGKTLEQAETLQQQQAELQQQNEELSSQQDELRKSHAELEEKTVELTKSESNLQTQQEELRVINEELEEKTKSLEIETQRVNEKNADLEYVKKDLEKKAIELEASSTYKSEFLANMSHELRTPLNSLLILSKNLSGNPNNNFDQEQIESLDIIYNSGKDLLKLINDILDLSKIESGKMLMNYDHFTPEEIKSSLQQGFQHMADEKKLVFEVQVDKGVPEKIYTDFQRLGQVLKNLTSNAIKFTQEGKISIKLFKPKADQEYHNEHLKHHETLGISVTDTGIGISKDKIEMIFEAFKQADGSTSRKYGGTGLGLSISKELAKLMGGEIQLESQLDKGSTFTLFIPINAQAQAQAVKLKDSKVESEPKVEENPISLDDLKTKVYTTDDKPIKHAHIEDDRALLAKEDQVILIIEDDVHFARILQKHAKSSGFKTLVATRGSEGLALANQHHPSAIILDIKLPDIDGMKVLDTLKYSAHTRHIPVHMMSAMDFSLDASEKGAIGFSTKPVSQEELTGAFNKIESFIQKDMRELLIVEDDENLRKSIRKLIGEAGINITESISGKDCLKQLKKKHYDCMILDLGLPDMSGFDLLKKIERIKDIDVPPVIVYTGKELSKEENEELAKYSNSIIIKGVKSQERLLDETALFMHRVVKELPEQQQNIITKLHAKDDILKNKKVLIVDDDMRNVFALTKILAEKNIQVLKAENGMIGIERLNENPDVDLVLMDIMMPVMDGYESMKKIRKMQRFKDLPIIALTAKAMKNDAEKCMNAGANEYLSKPLEAERLFSLMRVWLYKN